jgi:predicted MPP superfamily phosphohydrolase
MNRERLRTVVAHALAQEPDLAVVTGDFVVAHTRDEDLRASVQELVAELSVLAEQQPTLAVLGNHDYWTNAEAVRAGLMATGILELRNEVYTFSKAGGRLHVAGVDDVWEGQHRLGAVLEQLPADDATVLLAHEPDFADESAKTGRFDLQLSGHSHGGQVVLPLLGPPALPWLGRKYPAGSYQVGQMQLYTNRGVGMIAPYVRFNCRPEITVFTLESTELQLAEPARDA